MGPDGMQSDELLLVVHLEWHVQETSPDEKITKGEQK